MPRDVVKRKAWEAAYAERKRERMREYDATPERRAARAAYKQTSEGREAEHRYRTGDAGRAAGARSRPVTAVKTRERQAMADAIKLAAGCVDCGYRAHAVALDFDHVTGEKISGVSRLVKAHVPWQEVLDEMAKCEIVCANCHRVRTFERRDYLRSANPGNRSIRAARAPEVMSSVPTASSGE